MVLSEVSEGVLVLASGPRDPDLPSMYRVKNHPLMKKKPRNEDSTAIVYLADLTDDGCLKSVKVAGRQRIPGPGRQNMLNSGKSESSDLSRIQTDQLQVPYSLTRARQFLYVILTVTGIRSWIESIVLSSQSMSIALIYGLF